MEAEQAPPSGSARDWSELPLDALASVSAKLGAVEILMGAGLVCHSWLRAAKVPYLWRSIHMEKSNRNVVAERCRPGGRHVLCAMAKEAVDCAAGQLEVFVGEEFPDDDLFKYIGRSAPSLKVLRLTSCADILNEGFVEAINMFPLLEELKLSACGSIGGRATYEAVGKACPNLMSFEIIKDRPRPFWVFGSMLNSAENLDADEAHGVAAMHGLRSLKISFTNITNEALAAILGNCPDLESFDLPFCLNIVMDDAMRAKCAGIKMSVHPNIDQWLLDCRLRSISDLMRITLAVMIPNHGVLVILNPKQIMLTAT